MNSKAKKNLFFISFYTFIFHFKEVRIFIQSLLLVVCCITMVGPLLKIQNKIDVLRHYITMASTFFFWLSHCTHLLCAFSVFLESFVNYVFVAIKKKRNIIVTSFHVKCTRLLTRRVKYGKYPFNLFTKHS